MADFGKKIQSDNKHLSNGTSARYVYVDGGKSSITVRPKAGRLLRIIIFTKGLAFTVDNGSEPIANIATATPEGDYNIGVYCDTNIVLNGISGTGSALVVFDE